MIRLFVGIPIPDHISKSLTSLQNGVPGARWVEPRNMHITLRFIGEVDENIAEDIAQALDSVSTHPFEIALTGIGTFGRPTHTLWAGVEEDPKGTLGGLHRTIDGVLIRTGLEPERRKYSPHMTLARFARRSGAQARLPQYLETHTDLMVDRFCVTGFTLYESQITHRSIIYNPLYQYDFFQI